MYPVKKHPSISIADQGTLLKFLPAHATAFLRLIVCLAAPAACRRPLRPSRWRITKSPIPPTIRPPVITIRPPARERRCAANLHTIISAGFNTYNYGDARTILPILWEDPNDSSRMILVYNNQSIVKPNPSGTNPAGLPGWDGGTTWNREHLWPKSLLGLTSSQV